MSEATDLYHRVLSEVAHDGRLVALVAESRSPSDDRARLAWWLGHASRDCPDRITVVSHGVDWCLDKNLSVSAAIEAWAELSLARDRASLETLRSSGHDVRDPATLTLEEIRREAAEEVIEHSYEGLFATLGGVLGANPDPRFWAQILEAATAFPDVLADLLWEEKLLRHRMSRA